MATAIREIPINKDVIIKKVTILTTVIKENNLGLWQISFEFPWDYRKDYKQSIIKQFLSGARKIKLLY